MANSQLRKKLNYNNQKTENPLMITGGDPMSRSGLPFAILVACFLAFEPHFPK